MNQDGGGVNLRKKLQQRLQDYKILLVRTSTNDITTTYNNNHTQTYIQDN